MSEIQKGPRLREDSERLISGSGAMGMAAIGVALWAYVMKYSPKHPTWFNRDRFILSNGIAKHEKTPGQQSPSG